MKEVIRYKELKGTKEQRREQFKKQLDKSEKDIKEGKVICISDLIGNGESFIEWL